MFYKFIYLHLGHTLLLSYIVNNLVPVAYMDEIFHFPQAAKYFNGIFTEWDPKITTPPGLYLATVSLLFPLSNIAGLEMNKIQCFRLINVFFTVGIFYLVYKILRMQQNGKINSPFDDCNGCCKELSIDPNDLMLEPKGNCKCCIYCHLSDRCATHCQVEKRMALLSALNISMFPVLYFFTFLYYTDCGSTFFVLLMYYNHLKNSFILASVAGAVSIFFRQTNIVWVFYVAAEESLHSLLMHCKELLTKKDKDLRFLTLTDFTKKCHPLWIQNFQEISKKLYGINYGYIPVAFSFIALVIYNGSIALGDKSAHQVCINVPQIFYFLLFVLFFSSPYLISVAQIKEFISFVSNHKLYISALCLFCSYCIKNLTHVHPYLLADNRHLTFYLWRRVLGKDYVSILLIPLYMYSGWSIITITQHKKHLFKIILLFCFIVAIVPQKLLEFRYFIIPYIMLRLNIRPENKWQPYVEFLLYASINYIVLYLFLFKTFTWNDSDDVQRFMW